MLSNFLLLLYFLLPSACICRDYKSQPFTIMIDHAGDVLNSGRSLLHGFERGQTMQFAKELKLAIQAYYPQINVILSKTANEVLTELQIANFANRLDIDLFLSIYFFKETNIKPQIFLYQFRNQNFFNSNLVNQLHFFPYHQAFLVNFDLTKRWITLIKNNLQAEKYKHYFICHENLAIPFKPLVGIICPAIGIEIGIKENGWDCYIDPVAKSLNEIIYAL